jgi:hypothetical protein
MLFRLAEASLEQPEGVVREVIFPVVSEERLAAIGKEWSSTGPLYRSRVQTRIRGSYRSHYRRLLAPLLNTLVFRSNNERHRPVIEALALLKRYLDCSAQYYPPEEAVPIDGVVPDAWREAIVEPDPSERHLRCRDFPRLGACGPGAAQAGERHARASTRATNALGRAAGAWR